MKNFIIGCILLIGINIYANFSKTIYLPNVKKILDVTFEYIDQDNNENINNIELDNMKITSTKIIISSKKPKNNAKKIIFKKTKKLTYISIVFIDNTGKEIEKSINVSNAKIKQDILYVYQSSEPMPSSQRKSTQSQTAKVKQVKQTAKVEQVKPYAKVEKKETTHTKPPPIIAPKKQQNTKENAYHFEDKINLDDFEYFGKSENLEIKYLEKNEYIYLYIKGREQYESKASISDDLKKFVVNIYLSSNETIKASRKSKTIKRMQIGYHKKYNLVVLEIENKRIKKYTKMFRATEDSEDIIEYVEGLKFQKNELIYRIDIE